MSSNTPGFFRLLLTPAGAAIAIISFFLPWIQISCLGTSVYSGFDFGEIYWLVPSMAAIILGGYLLLRKSKRLNLLKILTIAATVVAIGVIVYGSITVAGGKRILLVKLGPDDVHLKIHVGGYGTFAGYLLAMIGVTQPRRKRKERLPTNTTTT